MLRLFSIAALALAVATLVVEACAGSSSRGRFSPRGRGRRALRRWRPGRSRRWRRVVGRGVLVVGLALGGLALLTAIVPTLPKPSGPHSVGSVIFRWTDTSRPETFTADPSDHRQVIAQAWYPTDATTGRAVPYFEAQGRLPSSIAGLPSFMFASFGSVATHATVATPVSAAQRTWPVLFFSPGLSIPREPYTALCADLASRGYVVVALSVPYESAVSVLAGGRVVGQTIHPDVMGPPPHPALERLIDIRVADSRFALDQLDRLAQLEPRSPLAGHLDLQHVGIVGHSIGGATAVQVMASDPRFKVGVNLDGKLFGTEPDARLEPAVPLDRVRRGADRRSTRKGGTASSRARATARAADDPGEPAPELHRRSVVPDVAWAWPDRCDARHGLGLARWNDVDDRGRDRRLRRPGARRRARAYPRGRPRRLPRDSLAVADGRGGDRRLTNRAPAVGTNQGSGSSA